MFLEISQNSQENACARVSFLIKLQAIKKETLVQVFSCEFDEFFYRTPLDDCFWMLWILTIAITKLSKLLQNTTHFSLYQFYKTFKNKSPGYLFNIIPTKLRVHNARCCDNIPLLKINIITLEIFSLFDSWVE